MRRAALAVASAAASLCPVACAGPPVAPALNGARLEAAAFADLPGWAEDRHGGAYAAFRRSCARPIRTRPNPDLAADLEQVCDAARAAGERLSDADARAFFEKHFDPWRIAPAPPVLIEEASAPADPAKIDRTDKAAESKIAPNDPSASKTPVAAEGKSAAQAVVEILGVAPPFEGTFGFVTAYYEPELPGSLTPDPHYPVPLYGRPADLVTWPESGPPPKDAPKGFIAARRDGGALIPYFTRAEIQAGALNGRGLELAWVADPVDAFFAQIQGSLRLRLDDGRRVRIGYAARNGHPYTAIGKILAQRSSLEARKITMRTVREWLQSDPDRVHSLLNENRSFVFFRLSDHTDPDLGPPGAAGVQLTPGRSVAVDWRTHVYGSPLFVETRAPERPGGDQKPFRRLTIAQDTGTAIVGPARLDLFIGSGDEAGAIAGNVRHAEPRIWMLRPKSGGL